MVDSTTHSKISSFSAVSVRAALVQVRETLGEDALILDQRQVGDRVVIRATTDDGAFDQVVNGPSTEQNQQSQQHSVTDRSTDRQLLDELTFPERRVDRPVDVASETQLFLPPEELQLPPNDLSTEDALPAAHSQGPIDVFGEPVHRMRGAYRMVGASGVGKSSIILKLVSAWCSVASASKLAIISTDCMKLAGSEALLLACQMFGVEIIELEKLNNVDVARLNGFDLVLVDSPSLTEKHLSPVNGVKDLLVVSSQHSRTSLAAQIVQARVLSPVGIAVTHLDLPFDVAEVSEFLRYIDLPVYWTSNSSKITAGLNVANGNMLERWDISGEGSIDAGAPPDTPKRSNVGEVSGANAEANHPAESFRVSA